MIPSLAACRPEIIAYIRRLHFNWLGLPVASVAEAAPAAAAAAAAGLGVMLSVDAAEMDLMGANALVRQVSLSPAAGVRCIAAHRLPFDWWERFLASARRARPDQIWILDALGVPVDIAVRLLEAGFDHYLSSVKWWDGREDWLVEQHERLRPLGRSLGFPENLAGERLVAELVRGGTDPSRIAAHYRLRLALAAFVDAGLIVPLGFEIAATDVGEIEPADSDIDLRQFVTALNRLNATQPTLNAMQALRAAPAGGVIMLVKQKPGGGIAGCFIANTGHFGLSVDMAEASYRTGFDLAKLSDVTPMVLPRLATRPIWLEPAEWRIFVEPPEIGQHRPPRRRDIAVDASHAACRIVIAAIEPAVDGGRHPIKRAVGDRLEVWADIFRDGHDVLAADLLFRAEGADAWSLVPMRHHENDRWVGVIPLKENRRHVYCIEAWTDLFASWRDRTGRKHDAGQDIQLDLDEGRAFVARAADCADGETSGRLRNVVAATDTNVPSEMRLDRLFAAEVASCMAEWGPRADVTRSDRDLEVFVDRRAAVFGSWYEMFPRSQGSDPDRSATFRDCIDRLDDIRQMGFDVVYVTPIHPIGRKNRKGRNNSLVVEPGDPGSPYAIGSAEGGHDAVHPDLGTLDDFRAFVTAVRARDMEVALDLAVQCAPDHPWLTRHPEWFERRADGSIRFAENPPKKYQDIVNLDFGAKNATEIWKAIRAVVLFWIQQGVHIFRVDNPHTKPFAFWEWLIRDIQTERPDVLFLAEAFTRPKPMEALAKLGFTQSYTYFTWRNEKQEIIDYFTYLTRSGAREYFRPHLFANTPDILPKFLQQGGQAAFRIRAVLAATLAGLFGIYNGFELCENRALPKSEEYLDSEKYQYKVWDWNKPGNIKPLIVTLNRIRRENPVFGDWLNLEFLPCDNERVIFFARRSPARGNSVFIAVTLDPFAAQSATITLPLGWLGLSEHQDIAADDLLTGETLRWVGSRQSIFLDPSQPALIVRPATSLPETVT